jgi:uncharacterized protein (TIGR03382 family)
MRFVFRGLASAGLLLMEDFDDGVADGWNLAAGAVPATLVTDPVNSTPALGIETTGLQRIAETPSFNLTGATFVRIIFDFAAGGASPQATRWADLQFFDGTAWIQIDRIRHNDPNATGLVYEITSGFSVNNQFRFVGKADSGSQRSLVFDNVKIISDVPAPPTLALFAVAGLLLLRRRKSG